MNINNDKYFRNKVSPTSYSFLFINLFQNLQFTAKFTLREGGDIELFIAQVTKVL